MQSLPSSAENVAQSTGLQNCLDVSERLVEEEETTDLGTTPTIAAAGPARLFMGRLLNAISPASGSPAAANVTERRPRAANTVATEGTQQAAGETELQLQGQIVSFPQEDELAATRVAKAKAAHAIAELEAATDEAAARGAVARRQAAAAILETQQFETALAKSRSASPASVTRSQGSPTPPHSPTQSTRAQPKQDTPSQDAATANLVWMFQQMEVQRREERSYFEAQRREERREAEDRIDRLEARHQAELATVRGEDAGYLPGTRRHNVGVALSAAIPSFVGDGTENWDEFQRLFERMAIAHNIPESMWTNELIVKLKGVALGFCDTQFPVDGPRPEWSALTSALQRQFGRRYAAAPAWHALNAATRQPNETGPAALQRLRELARALTVLGVPSNPGPNERVCYVMQNMLGEEERVRWMAAANTIPGVSEASIRDKEAAAAQAPHPGRLSIAIEERDEWFLLQRRNLESFLADQVRVVGGRGLPARAAPIDAGPTHPCPSPAAAPWPATPAVEPPQEIEDGYAARLCAAVAAWESRAAATDRAPPLYHSHRHRAKNQAIFEERKAKRECFKCSPTQLVPGQLHYDCPLHGRHATGGAARKGVAGSGGGGFGQTG